MGTVSPADFSLEEVLSVGRAVIVDPCSQEDDKSLRFGAFIRGWLVEDYVLVDARTEADRAGMLNRGQPCVIRFMADGSAYAFTSRVIDMGSGTYYSFFRVVWPKEIKKVSVRKHERVSVSIPVAVETGDGTPIRGDLIDLSAGGCRVDIPKGLEKSDNVTISFNLPDGTAMDKISCLVRNVIQSKGRFLIGFQFQNLSEEQVRDIEFYVTSTLSRRRAGETGTSWVLIVDSEPQRIQPLQKGLEDEKIKVILEDTPATGIGRLTLSLPALMLIPDDLGGCSGMDVCRIVRTNPKFHHLPIYIYSEKSPVENDLLKKSEQAGANGVYFSVTVVEPIVKAIKKQLTEV